MTWLGDAAGWYLVLLAVSLMAAPWLRLLCAGLPDWGATIARPVGLLALIYPSWLLATLGFLPYSTAGLWATLFLLGVTGWGVALWRGAINRGWLRYLLVAEAFGVVAYVAAIWLRGFTPAISLTEKPMDSAFLHSSAAAAVMPPLDPWMAGETINYYYLGYVVQAAVGRLGAVSPEVGFNLALATTVSMTLTAAAGLGFNFVRRLGGRRLALVSAALLAGLVALFGNLYPARRLVTAPVETSNASWWWDPMGIGWRSSRIVCDGQWVAGDCVDPVDPGRTVQTINEFPFFSFLLGDLHPHVLALPFTVVAFALALNLARNIEPGATPRLTRQLGLIAALTGAVVGGLYPMNSWDYPTFLVVALGALMVGARQLPWRVTGQAGSVLVGASLITWLPFTLTFVPQVAGDPEVLPSSLQNVPVVTSMLTTVGVYTGPRTSVGEFLTVFGAAWAVSIAFLAWALLRPTPSDQINPISRMIIVPAILFTVLAVLMPAPMLLLCGLPLLASVTLLQRGITLDPRTIAVALYAFGYALLLITEFFFIQDLFGTRMNTVFKVYYQVWTLFAAATVLALFSIWRDMDIARLARPALAAGVALLVVAGSLYPAMASYQYTERFADWRGLDGIAYLEATAPDGLAAIEWLKANADQDDVVLEAAGCSYGLVNGVPLNRMSAYTGIPTVIGWGFHEAQWRSGQPELSAEIGLRQAAVAQLYQEPTAELLRDYGVTLIVVGLAERVGSDTCTTDGPYAAESGIATLTADGWSPVFASGDVQIFHRAGVEAAGT